MQTLSEKGLRLVKSTEVGEENEVSEESSKSLLTIDEYYQHAEQYAREIRKTHDVNEIIRILDAVLSETRDLHQSDEMSNTRQEVSDAEQKIESLKHELALIRELVHTDQMTGLFNRRGLDEHFIRETARADRSKNPLCVILIDLDNFKEINETYGYPFGDNVLISFARMMMNALRPTDVVARYGGEEFVILLPDTEIDEAVRVIQRLQRTLANRPILNADNQPVSISFSGGVALRQADEHQHAVIKRADEALSRAKNIGSSQIEVAP
ncbi:GGDEF domain-containing protein [Nitrosomonas sp. Nm33]|uniref:GGDEF domain-containing protein n=1 Tax=Nitrosomonas sp. Nm33 TaxID=133724 RepID=UPI000899092C|nr:GGDEF domain-containing protein [Nitrosomonas sp. Nm33]SDY77003.1 diguanylate cyclase [Nitrosomonas sp. Nm33]